MSGEVWAFIGVAITAVVGGSGIAGVLTGAVELSQRNRLRRRAEKLLALADLLPEKSSQRRAVEHAAAVDATRLAALSVVELDPRLRFLGSASAGVTVAYVVLAILFATANPKGFLRSFAIGGFGVVGNFSSFQLAAFLCGFALLLAVVVVWAFSNAVRERRARYVREVLDGRDPRDAAGSTPWPVPENPLPS